MARTQRPAQVSTQPTPKRTKSVRGAKPRYKAWCFTLNQPKRVGGRDGTIDDLRAMKPKFNEEVMRYLVFQMEQGEGTSHPHYQGYVIFKTRQMYIRVKSSLHQSVHVEHAKGTFNQNYTYCTKEQGRIEGPWEFGEPDERGKRNDLLTIKKHLDEGGSLEWVRDNYYKQWLKMRLSLTAHHDSLLKARDWKTRVIVIYGPAGTGKTKWVHERLKGKEVYWKPSGNKWFNGYDRHEYVVFDDYRGSWMEYTLLKSIMDRYPCTVEPKNRAVQFVAKELYITTNIHPRNWFSKYYDDHPGAYKEIFRRIDELYFKGDVSTPLVMEKNVRQAEPPVINMNIDDQTDRYDMDGERVVSRDTRSACVGTRPRPIDRPPAEVPGPTLTEGNLILDEVLAPSPLDEEHFHEPQSWISFHRS